MGGVIYSIKGVGGSYIQYMRFYNYILQIRSKSNYSKVFESRKTKKTSVKLRYKDVSETSLKDDSVTPQ